MSAGGAILLTGGSACGKSSLAEALVCTLPGPRIYIATMRPFGAGGAEKVARHRALRAGKGFETVECYGSLRDIDERVFGPHPATRFPEAGTVAHRSADARIDARPVVLLECIANLTANLLFDDDGSVNDSAAVVDEICAGAAWLRARSRLLVVVTNDVGADGCAYGAGTDAYVHVLGTANCRLAAACDTVAELVAGCPQVLKGALPPIEVTEGAVRW